MEKIYLSELAHLKALADALPNTPLKTRAKLAALWDELTGRLAGLGFGNFRRLLGGFPEDADPEEIAADRYGREKYGEGDLRILAQKIAASTAERAAAR